MKEYTLKVKQGSTLAVKLVFKNPISGENIDMTGSTYRLQCRPSVSSGTVLFELTSENGGVDLTDALNGILILRLTATQTAALTVTSGVYDMEKVTGSNVDTILSGKMELTKEVTR